MDTTRYELRLEPPTVEEYVRLRKESGLSPKTVRQAAPALENSWCWVSVRERESGSAVAMGRVLGDGGWCFLIADMATPPEHQRQGIGRKVLQALLDKILEIAPPHAFITLFGDPPGMGLYRSMGFVESAPGSTGMKYVGAPLTD